MNARADSSSRTSHLRVLARAALQAVLLGVALASCATAQVAVPPTEASALARTLAGEPRYLRVSMYVTPFFGDATKRLLTALPPDEVELLANPDGTPVSPGPIQGVLPVGTRVRIREVEFPSAMVMTQRVLFTPRTLVWIHLDVAGNADAAARGVLVLRPGLRTSAELLSELERYLAADDPSPRLDAWPESVRAAVRAKEAQPEMPAEALEMAWGYPERKRLELSGTQRQETWTWPRKRSAVLLDGRVSSLSPAPR